MSCRPGEAWARRGSAGDREVELQFTRSYVANRLWPFRTNAT
jgi:hypothetical protein